MSPWMLALSSSALWALGLAALIWHRRRLLDTTLVGAWWWAVIALSAVSWAEFAIASSGRANWAESVRYAAAMTVFCPQMAALGAKRPQSRAWPLVVLSLWSVLAAPAVEAMIVRPGGPIQLGDLRAWAAPALLAIGFMDRLATRAAPAAVCIAAGQAALTCRWWPLIPQSPDAWVTQAGIGLLVAGVATGGLLAAGRRPRAAPFDRLWLEFRDLFGTLWSLRVAERVNAAARQNRWPVSLSWGGLVETASGEGLTAEQERQLLANFRNLLRRFVSPDWIRRRLDEGAGPTVTSSPPAEYNRVSPEARSHSTEEEAR